MALPLCRGRETQHLGLVEIRSFPGLPSVQWRLARRTLNLWTQLRHVEEIIDTKYRYTYIYIYMCVHAYTYMYITGVHVHFLWIETRTHRVADRTRGPHSSLRQMLVADASFRNRDGQVFEPSSHIEKDR